MPAGTLTLKRPLASVTAPMPGVPVTMMFAAMTGSLPGAETTTPVAVICPSCALAAPKGRARKRSVSKRLFIFVLSA